MIGKGYNYNELAAFVLVARERSFTRAAAKLGVSQSALSQTIRGLEKQLDVRLLARSTRSVAPTEAGLRLFKTIEPRFKDIEQELAWLSQSRDKPAGTLRINAGEHPAISVLQPALRRLLSAYPDLNVEISVDYKLTDIVAEGFDAGVRMGNLVAKDMIAVRIGPDLRMAIVGSPEYFARYSIPTSPQDLAMHNCINIRLPTYEGIPPWDLDKNGHEVNVRVAGQLIFNNINLRLNSVLEGLGLAYLPEDLVLPHIETGRLIRVMSEWCEPFPGYHLYYPNRRHPSPAFALLVETLRYHG